MIQKLRAFFEDDQGSAGLEFVCTCPLLFGVLIFTAEYGKGLQVRTALDGAVSDAVRLLSRAPVGLQPSGAGTMPMPYASFVTEAQRIIEDRTGHAVTDAGPGKPAFEVQVEMVDTGNFRTDYYVVKVTATVYADMPMMSFLNSSSVSGGSMEAHGTGGGDAGSTSVTTTVNLPDAQNFATGVAMTATAEARYVGAVPPGLVACQVMQRITATCPTS